MALSRLGLMARSHWKKQRPKMVAHLEAKGLLDRALEETQERAKDALADLVTQRGIPHDQAWEMVTSKLIFLPSEEEMKTLPVDLMSYSQMDDINPSPQSTIIVSDDDQGIRQTLAEFLSMSGYFTYEAPSAEAALDLLEQHQVDLITTDISKPVMDGFEFTRIVKAKHGIPVIIATGCREIIKEVEAKDAGADILMFKPIKFKGVLSNIRSLLGLK
jgi:CheY-like chemotaxis protein